MKIRISILLVVAALSLVSCNEVLDRPSPTVAEDETYWTSAEKLDVYANGFYDRYFIGYGTGWSTSGAPLQSFTFSDDVVNLGTQSNFTRSVPSSSIWSYSYVRKAQIMVERIDERMKGILSSSEYSHWMGIARLFRGLEYARLCNTWGDVPYYDHVLRTNEKDELYKDRMPRKEVMNHVWDDFNFAIENIGTSAGAFKINRYVAAAMVSRWALKEGSWQKYYYKDNDQAAKFFSLAKTASDIVISSGRYDIAENFRALFGSFDLSSSKDVILYRKYDAAHGVTHCIASYCNPKESRANGPTLDLIKSFICVDGNDWQTSTVEDAKDFTLSALIKTRDPRFEATFYGKPASAAKSSYLFAVKFIPRSALAFLGTEGGTAEPQWTSVNNLNGYPVFRYAEVLLNWIEAKAELETLGEGTVTQEDIDMSINKIRSRPLDEDALKAGVTKTAPMSLSSLPNDPERDDDVPQLLWEIRRERRMEFAFEYSRYEDLRRWHKLDYMDTDANKDLLYGTWVNFAQEDSAALSSGNVDKLRVVDMDGNEIVYDGKNGSKMRGFYFPMQTVGRLQYLNLPNVNPYLSPIGTNNIEEYKNKGYTLTQTEGWPLRSN